LCLIEVKANLHSVIAAPVPLVMVEGLWGKNKHSTPDAVHSLTCPSMACFGFFQVQIQLRDIGKNGSLRWSRQF